MFFEKRAKTAERENELEALRIAKRRADVLDASCGVGLWDAVLINADAMHPQSQWTWSSEFRRLMGFSNAADFPNLVTSWSDRLHPEDAPRTFEAFANSLKDTTGRCSYNVEYRLKMRDGAYRWFRATGGCNLDALGRVHACGSLVDIQEQKLAQFQVEREVEATRAFVAALSQGIARLADGDLVLTIDADLNGAYGDMKTHFNEAVQRLRHALTEVSTATQNIQAGARQISSAADDLSHRIEEQAASVEETAAAMEEITATVKRTAEDSLRASNVVHSAKADAEKSGEVVREAVKAMGEIEGSSRQISQIIGVIDEIAFQTNLLALNAGVEAARAGEAGRGFAVVASEVRALAQRSADAAKEIKTLISTSSQHVSKGVGLVDSTGQTLQGIIAKVTEAADLVSSISTSAQEQSSSIAQVNQAVTQIDQVTQRNAAVVEEAAASGRSLTTDAEHLSDLVGKFKVSAKAAAAPPPARRSPMRAAA